MHASTTSTLRATAARRRRSLAFRYAAAAVILATTLAALAVEFAPAGSSATDPGVALYTYMHDHGATMPASWAQIVDANHALICHNYSTGFAGWPADDRDDYGVTVPLGEAAIAETGFCS